MKERPTMPCKKCEGAGCHKCGFTGFHDKIQQHKAKQRTGEPKGHRPLKNRSDKMTKAMRMYCKFRLAFLRVNPTCVCIDEKGRCFAPAVEVHHRRGRHGYLLKMETWMPVCRYHHDLIEMKREWARRCGYLVNRVSDRELPPLTNKFLPYDPPIL